MEDNIKERKAEMKKGKRREGFLALALVSPYLIVFILFTLIPVICGFVFSFMRYNPYQPDQNEFVGLQNYINIFNFDLPISKAFWESFSTMLVFDIVAVPCLIIIPLVLAYFIIMQPPGYKIFRALIYLPSVVSVSIMGIIFGNMFAGDSSGLINAWLNTEIHWLSGTPWHGDTLRWLVMLIASIWWGTGTNFVIFSGALKNIPKSLYEACEMDGGSKWKRILHVSLPYIKTSITICLFNTLIAYLALYGQVVTLNDQTNVNILVSPMMFIQNYLSGGVTYARQTGFICASAIIFGLITMIFGQIQRSCMADRKRKNKHTTNCEQYHKSKQLLGVVAETMDAEVDYE